MIGAFARKLGSRDRVVSCEETDGGYQIQSTSPGGEARRDEGRDAPPEAFVEKVSDEGGDVFLAPVLDALRDALRRRRAPADPATNVPQASTPAEGR